MFNPNQHAFYGNSAPCTPSRPTGRPNFIHTPVGLQSQVFPTAGISQCYTDNQDCSFDVFINSNPQLELARSSFSTEQGRIGKLKEVYALGADSSHYEETVSDVLGLQKGVAKICTMEEDRLLQMEKIHFAKAEAAAKSRREVGLFKTNLAESFLKFNTDRYSIKSHAHPLVLTVDRIELNLLASRCALDSSPLHHIRMSFHLLEPHDVTSLDDDAAVVVLTAMKQCQQGKFRQNEERNAAVDFYDNQEMLSDEFMSRRDIRGDVTRHSKNTIRGIIAINLGLVPQHVVDLRCLFVPRVGDSLESCWEGDTDDV